MPREMRHQIKNTHTQTTYGVGAGVGSALGVSVGALVGGTVGLDDGVNVRPEHSHSASSGHDGRHCARARRVVLSSGVWRF